MKYTKDNIEGIRFTYKTEKPVYTVIIVNEIIKIKWDNFSGEHIGGSYTLEDINRYFENKDWILVREICEIY